MNMSPLRSTIVIAILSLFAFTTMAQAEPVNVFGPATFVQGQGEPKLETRNIDPAGVSGPYVLHLQNGDGNGKNRVSSAKIWLNGNPIFGPSDFSQNFTGKDMEVQLENPSTLEVKIASAPGSQLTIRIEGSKTSLEALGVGPEGGTLKFGNGVVLDIPPGAVTEQTEISIKDLPFVQVNEILSNPLISSSGPKRLLGGYVAGPDGIVFKVPITAWIPVLPLNPGGIPMRIELMLNEQRYRYSSSTIIYDGVNNMVQMEINHFSGEAVVELTGPQIEALCTVCGTNSNPVCVQIAAPEPTCCLLHPSDRESCPTAQKPCVCCRELGVAVVASSTDLTGGGCQILGTDLQVTFPLCPNPTPTNFCENETAPVNTDPNNSGACDRLVVTMAISPAEDRVLGIGQTQKYSAKATGTKDGVTLFQDQFVDPIWSSSDNNIANIDQITGTVTGVNANYPDFITIGASMSECSPTKALVKVQVVDLDVTPKQSSLFPGESVTLKAFSKNAKGEEIPIDVMWDSDNPSVANVGQPLGTETVVSSNPSVNTGVAVITATHIATKMTVLAVVTIKNLFVTPDLRYLGPGQSVELNATTKDQSGGEKPIVVSWSSDNPSVANCNPTVGSKTVINATNEGTAIITAKDEMTGATAKAKIAVQDCIEAWNWNRYPPYEAYSPLTTPELNKIAPQYLASDGQGNVFAAWEEPISVTTAERVVKIGRFNNISGGFEAIATFPMATLTNFFVDSRGNMILLYIPRGNDPGNYYTDGLWARRYNIDRGWDAEHLLVPPGFITYYNMASHIAADKRGNAFVALSFPSAFGVSSYTYTVGVWRYDVDLGWVAYAEMDHVIDVISIPKIAMNPRGDAIVAWTGQDADRRTVLARRYQLDKGWDQVSTQIFSPQVLEDHALNVLMDAQGNAIVSAYAWGSGTWAMHLDNLTGWSSPIRIAQNPDPNHGNYLRFSGGGYYRISMDETGNAMIVFEQMTSPYTTSLRSRRYTAGVGWDNTVETLEDEWTARYTSGDHLRHNIAFRMHGNGSATLIATQISGYNYLDPPNNSVYSYARHYTPCTGWSAANILYLGSDVWVCVPPRVPTYKHEIRTRFYVNHLDTRGNGIIVWGVYEYFYELQISTDYFEKFVTRFTPIIGGGTP